MKVARFVALGAPHELCVAKVSVRDNQEITISGKLDRYAVSAIATAIRVAVPDHGAEVEILSTSPVSGISCGLAVATAAYADLHDVKLDDRFVYSGAVLEDGTVVKADGLDDKRQFANSLGYALISGGFDG